VASIPVLRSFARGLCGDATTGDDLAQDTLLKAWQHRAQFTTGTNLKGWLLKIARNHFYSQRRRLVARDAPGSWSPAPRFQASLATIRFSP
jgi:RNA polymerase sigma-70 factor (ECF subfamily)